MAEGKKSFVLYADLISVVEKRIEKDREDGTNISGELFFHILEYVNDRHPKSDNFIVEMAFEPIRLVIDDYFERLGRGEYHWNWKGGISDENHVIRNSTEMKDWRMLIFERDEYTCQKCGNIGGELNAHHIKPFSKYPKLRFDVGNGLTLCKKCHIEIHKIMRKNDGRMDNASPKNKKPLDLGRSREVKMVD